MTKTKADHCVMITNGMQCLHCGDIHKLNVPIAIDKMTATIDAFIKRHKSCNPQWEAPKPDMDSPKSQRIKWWLDFGERGTSSIVIYNTFNPVYKIYGYDEITHPSDPDDFRRCYLLLKAVPEFKERIQIMAKVSDVWKRLVENWDKLTEMFEVGMASKTGRSSEMYEFMKSIGC